MVGKDISVDIYEIINRFSRTSRRTNIGDWS